MIDWYRQRARQERMMAQKAARRSARWSHEQMLRLLVNTCASQPGLDRSVCAHCDLRSLCRGIHAQSLFTRSAA